MKGNKKESPYPSKLRRLLKAQRPKPSRQRNHRIKIGEQLQELHQGNERQDKPFIKKKKSLMTTWEVLDLLSSKDKDEEANLCLIADIMPKDKDNEEVNFNNLEYLQIVYQDTNPKGPKKFRVPKTMVILVAYVFNKRKKTHVVVLG
ncbi:hypothetical protein CR513_11726, partial [Mucuna pruriens]